MDDEPSPEPKWVRVDVPGADGAVDLSRALAGQTTYEMREIRLGFGGKCASHAAALALVHQMRRALHGARVRVETLLTAQIGGYYIADCECDGIAYASGDVEVTVNATADPFIRVGNQTLALPAASEWSGSTANVEPVPTGYDPGVATFVSRLVREQELTVAQTSPVNATSARLWWTDGANLLDVSMWPYAKMCSTPATVPFTYVNGQTIRLTTMGSDEEAHIQIKASDATVWPSWPYSLPFSDFSYWSGPGVGPSGQRLLAFVTGIITAVGASPAIRVTAVANGTGTDVLGFVQGATTSKSFTPSVGTVSQTLTFDLRNETWSDAAHVLSAIKVSLENATGNVYVKLMLTCDAGASAWEQPDIGCSTMTWGSPVGYYDARSDAIYFSPLNPYVRHFVTTDGDGTSTAASNAELFREPATLTAMPPSDAAWVSSTVEQDGGPTAATWLTTQYPTPSTATGTNSTMRSTPSITTSDGASVTIDGRTAIVGPGTVALPALVIPGGTFTVYYSLFGVNPSDATLSWEGGVL